MFAPFLKNGDRFRDYTALAETAQALVSGETDRIANLSNLSALLNWFLDEINWVGFYLWNQEADRLILGPFQGLPACLRIAPGKGVCGTAFEENRIIIVPDVLRFPGHIACDGASRSEIVIPLVQHDAVCGVLDIDSPITDRFDRQDAAGLEPIAAIAAAL